MTQLIKRMILLLIALVLIIPIVSQVSGQDRQRRAEVGQKFSGRVVRVTDGDTLTVLRDGKEVIVRLNGIDCPEKDQPFGDRAHAFSAVTALSKDASVHIRDIDQYGRLVGDVKMILGGKSLNQELVKHGFAWWYHKYSKDDSLALLEIKARKDGLGLWANDNAIPPWAFRSMSKSTRPTPTPVVRKTSAVDLKIDDSQMIVFRTETGKNYHRSNCRHLAKSKLPILLIDAKKMGLTACEVCKPDK